MRNGLDKQSLIGIILILLVLGLGGWMILGRGGDEGVQKIDQGGSQDAQSELLAAGLQSQLKTGGYASFQTVSGSGKLSGGQSWSFKQTTPLQAEEAYDQAGNQIEPPSPSLGAGGRLVINGQVSQTDLQNLLRQSLSDIGLQVRSTTRGLVLVSQKLVSSPLRLSAGRVEVDNLFLRSACQDSAHNKEAALSSSCQATPLA